VFQPGLKDGPQSIILIIVEGDILMYPFNVSMINISILADRRARDLGRCRSVLDPNGGSGRFEMAALALSRGSHRSSWQEEVRA
jgi:hypothetical protein